MARNLYVEKLVEVPKVQVVDVVKQVSKPVMRQVEKQIVKPIYEVGGEVWRLFFVKTM